MSGTGERNTPIAEGGTQSIPVADDVSCAGQTRTHDVIIDRLLAGCSSRYECRPAHRDDINAISTSHGYEVFCFGLELRLEDVIFRLSLWLSDF